jgi:HD-GYP domain-containing protein (c-di-GMP phosphodiesterase class II)
VADIFDALTSERVYKKEWGFDEAFATLDKMANHGKIDSACVEALRRSRQEASQIMMRYGKGTVPRQTT